MTRPWMRKFSVEYIDRRGELEHTFVVAISLRRAQWKVAHDPSMRQGRVLAVLPC